MNNDQKVINKAIAKAVNKLVYFSLSEKVRDNGGLQVSAMSDFGAVWITTKCLRDRAHIEMISFPVSTGRVKKFNKEIEDFIAKANLELNQK